MLDLGVTDIAASAIQCALKYKADATQELKFMSKLTADLSVALINAGGEKELNTQEQEQFLSIKKTYRFIGQSTVPDKSAYYQYYQDPLCFL